MEASGQCDPYQLPLPPALVGAPWQGEELAATLRGAEPSLLLPEVINANFAHIMRLREVYDVEPGSRNIMQALAHKRPGAAAHMWQGYTLYTRKPTGNTGRSYVVGCAGLDFSKLGRTLCFGQDHMELDMVGAFYELLRRLVPNSGLATVGEVRRMLAEKLSNTPYARRFPDFVKKLPCVAINFQCGKIIERIIGLNLSVNDGVAKWLRLVEECKKPAVEAAIRRGMGQNSASYTERNNTYFHVEELEARFIRHFLASLVEKQPFNSIVLLHDGVLMEPHPLPANIEQAIKDASRAINVSPPIQVATEILLPKYHELLMKLEANLSSPPEWQINDKQKKLANLHRLRNCKRIPPENVSRHAAKQVQVRHQLDILALLKIHASRTERRNIKPGEVIEIGI
jgi:hypothetical protein